MSADLTPAGSAAVRLADALVRTKKQRDRARDLACAYEAQLAKVWALAESYRRATCVADGAPCSWHRVAMECADEIDAALDVADE